MKRSEMLNKITESIELMRGIDNGYYVYPEDNQIAEIILNKIEELGMLPPSYNMNEGSGEYGIPSFYGHGWEEE